LHSAVTPEKLYSLCRKLKGKGALGCLISGGYLPDGSIPIDKFIDAIEKIKKDFGLTIFVHVGIINFERTEKLREAGVDAALIDVIGADETIKEICNLDVTVGDYEASLEIMKPP